MHEEDRLYIENDPWPVMIPITYLFRKDREKDGAPASLRIDLGASVPLVLELNERRPRRLRQRII
jgi:hypothetical protein